MEKLVDLVIIGSGPSGLTAAIYAARANLKPVVFEGIEPGGQLTTTSTVENYPGFPEGVLGPELMDQMRQQAKRFGAEFITEKVNNTDLSSRPFKVKYGNKEMIKALCVIIATGASAKWLNLPSEQALRGHGVSSCATCDGFFFKDKRVAVVGGGDTAMEDAIHLTRFASEVIVIHRRDSLRASYYMQKRAEANQKISWQWDTVVEKVHGDPEQGVSGIQCRNVKTNERFDLDINGLFVAIGHHPNTEFLGDQLPKDNKGFIKTECSNVITTIPGVYAAGDIIDPRYRQAITAAGMGCMAALEAQEFIEINPL